MKASTILDHHMHCRRVALGHLPVFNGIWYCACQLQQLDDARQWFQRACEIGGEKKIKAMALTDDDLKPLWAEIR